MLLPSFKRLFTQDFSGQYQQLIDQISYYFNTDVEVLFQALNNNIDITNNLYGQVISLTITVDANGKPTQAVSFQSTLSTPFLGVNVINATNTSNIYPTGGIFCGFSQSGNTITINVIKGLPANTAFTLELVFYG